MWDTAGSEFYRSITKAYFRGALGVVLVYDITQMASFANLPYWLDQIRSLVEENCVIALMANKADIMFDCPEQRMVQKE